MRTTGRTCEVKTGESILALTAIPGLPLHVWQPRLEIINPQPSQVKTEGEHVAGRDRRSPTIWMLFMCDLRAAYYVEIIFTLEF